MSEPLPSWRDPTVPNPVQSEMETLRQKLDLDVPAKRDVSRNLLIATWNIKAFSSLTEKWLAEDDDSPKRDYRGLWAITEIISRFDVIALQEIKGDHCTVKLEDGSIIDAKPVNVTQPGEKTLVSIRPERVETNRERLSPDAHTLKAEVLEFIYMGDIFRTRLRVAGRDDFVVKTRNAPDQRRMTPGEQIEIGWLAEDCRALDA